MKKYIGALLAAAALVVLDQWTKYLAILYLKGRDAFVIWDGVFELQYLTNNGAAFGILQNQRILFLVFTAVIIAALAFVFAKLPSEKKYRPLQILCVLICAGAVGNMIDRLFRGYVVDFLYFCLIDFPIFNVADCYVTVSAVLLVLLLLFYYKEEDLEVIWK